MEAIDRFFKKVRKTETCWLWLGSGCSGGYGFFSENKKFYMAHRWSYERFVGPLGEGLRVCHKCDVPSCVNPAHLFLGTDLENQLDALGKGRSARKLTPVAVIQIRRLRATGLTYRELGMKFGVHLHTIRAVCRGKAWAWVA